MSFSSTSNSVKPFSLFHCPTEGTTWTPPGTGSSVPSEGLILRRPGAPTLALRRGRPPRDRGTWRGGGGVGAAALLSPAPVLRPAECSGLWWRPGELQGAGCRGLRGLRGGRHLTRPGRGGAAVPAASAGCGDPALRLRQVAERPAGVGGWRLQEGPRRSAPRARPRRGAQAKQGRGAEGPAPRLAACGDPPAGPQRPGSRTEGARTGRAPRPLPPRRPRAPQSALPPGPAPQRRGPGQRGRGGRAPGGGLGPRAAGGREEGRRREVVGGGDPAEEAERGSATASGGRERARQAGGPGGRKGARAAAASRPEDEPGRGAAAPGRAAGPA